jgi:hypothetical protein
MEVAGEALLDRLVTETSGLVGCVCPSFSYFLANNQRCYPQKRVSADLIQIVKEIVKG